MLTVHLFVAEIIRESETPMSPPERLRGFKVPEIINSSLIDELFISEVVDNFKRIIFFISTAKFLSRRDVGLVQTLIHYLKTTIFQLESRCRLVKGGLLCHSSTAPTGYRMDFRSMHHYDAFRLLFKQHATVCEDLVITREHMHKDLAVSRCRSVPPSHETRGPIPSQESGSGLPTPLERLSLVASALHEQGAPNRQIPLPNESMPSPSTARLHNPPTSSNYLDK